MEGSRVWRFRVAAVFIQQQIAPWNILRGISFIFLVRCISLYGYETPYWGTSGLFLTSRNYKECTINGPELISGTDSGVQEETRTSPGYGCRSAAEATRETQHLGTWFHVYRLFMDGGALFHGFVGPLHLFSYKLSLHVSYPFFCRATGLLLPHFQKRRLNGCQLLVCD